MARRSRNPLRRVWRSIATANVLRHRLVRTAEDLGTQGERPVNLILLDWLAAEFVESGWTSARCKPHRYVRNVRQSPPQTQNAAPRIPKTAPRARVPLPHADRVIRDQSLAVRLA